MNRERMLSALEPTYATKEATFAEGREVMPLLVIESKERVVVAGLAVDREQWEPLVMALARQERAEALFLVSDVRMRVVDTTTETYEYRGRGTMAEDPRHVEALSCLGIDLLGAMQAIRRYHVDDRGQLVWDEPEVFDGEDSHGTLVDLLHLALMTARSDR